MDLLQVIGWLGAILLLVAFILNLSGKMLATSTMYLILNLIGSALLLYNAYENEAYPFVTVNSFWVIFSTYKLFRR